MKGALEPDNAFQGDALAAPGFPRPLRGQR